jgi:hypothetical protein
VLDVIEILVTSRVALALKQIRKRDDVERYGGRAKAQLLEDAAAPGHWKGGRPN